jgi:hypothetical protein
MNHQTKLIMASMVMAGMLGNATAFAAEGHVGAKARFTVSTNLSELVEEGSDVAISIDTSVLKQIVASSKKTSPGIPLKHRWQKDGHDVPGETNATLSLSHVGFSDVGTYTLVLSGSAEEQSAPVHLSVFNVFTSHSNGGCLAVPIGDFTSGNNTICGGTGFDKYKVYFPFYGPNASPQSGIFTNYSGGANLDLTTCTNVNGTIDTAIMFQGNWLGMPQVACNDNDTTCSTGTSLSSCIGINLSPNNGSTSNSYRATIYFKSATLGTNTSVTFRWYYHN